MKIASQQQLLSEESEKQLYIHIRTALKLLHFHIVILFVLSTSS